MNPSHSEESPAFPDIMKHAGPIEQRYSVNTEDAKPIEQIYCIETEDAAPIEQKYSIKTEETVRSVQTEDVASIEQEHHLVTIEDCVSAEEDVTMEVKSLETNFKMPDEVCISLLNNLSVF